MPGPGFPYSKLDADQVIQQAFDETTDRLRVDASVTATIGDIVIHGDGMDPSSIQITDGTDTMLVNADGSINTNVQIDAADGDNIIAVGTEDGTFPGTQHPIRVDTTGTQSIYQMNTIVPMRFDSIYPTYPDPVTEIHVYKQSGSTVATVTIIFTNAAKTNISSIVRT